MSLVGQPLNDTVCEPSKEKEEGCKRSGLEKRDEVELLSSSSCCLSKFPNREKERDLTRNVFKKRFMPNI